MTLFLYKRSSLLNLAKFQILLFKGGIPQMITSVGTRLLENVKNSRLTIPKIFSLLTNQPRTRDQTLSFMNLKVEKNNNNFKYSKWPASIFWMQVVCVCNLQCEDYRNVARSLSSSGTNPFMYVTHKSPCNFLSRQKLSKYCSL